MHIQLEKRKSERFVEMKPMITTERQGWGRTDVVLKRTDP